MHVLIIITYPNRAYLMLLLAWDICVAPLALKRIFWHHIIQGQRHINMDFSLFAKWVTKFA